MKLENLKGQHILQGIEVGVMDIKNVWDEKESVNFVKFCLDGTTYLATEDPDDGYRSYMNELETVDEGCAVKLPDIRVFCKMRAYDRYGSDILEFYDIESAKCILAVGTDCSDSYYPYCVLEYYPENMACNKGRAEE